MKSIPCILFAFASLVAMAEDGATLAKPGWRTEILAPGVTIYRAESVTARKLRLNAVKVDLKDPGIRFTGTGKCAGHGTPLEEARTLYGPAMKKCEPCVRCTAMETTPAFFARCRRPVESGGRGLDMLVAFGSAQGGPPHSKGFACPGGVTISDGVLVGDSPRGCAATLIVRKDGTADFVERLSPADYPALAFARSGYNLIRRGGADITPPGGTIRGRLAAGLTADRRHLYIVTADVNDLERAAKDGVDYHDLNAIFEGLGVTDAAAFAFARNCELVVKDRNQPAGRILNGYAAPSVTVQVNSGIYRVAAGGAATPVSAAPAPAEENPVEARFAITPRLSQGFDSAKARVLKGQVKLAFSTSLPRFKRPVLNVVAVFDHNGCWRSYDVLCSVPNESGGTLADRDTRPESYSKSQPEVDANAWKTVVIANPKAGFFAGYGIPEKAKLLVYRLEVWQDGRLVCEYDSDAKLAKRLGLPEDWHVKGKYQGKIVYKYPPEPRDHDVHGNHPAPRRR